MKETESDKEWVMYNDNSIKNFTGNWPSVVEYCIGDNFYPTVLFYEKLASEEEEDADYKDTKEFEIDDSQLR